MTSKCFFIRWKHSFKDISKSLTNLLSSSQYFRRFCSDNNNFQFNLIFQPKNFFFDSAVQMTCFTLLKRRNRKRSFILLTVSYHFKKTNNKTTPNKKVDQERKNVKKSNGLSSRSKTFLQKRQKIIILDVLELLSEVSSEGYFRQTLKKKRDEQ